MPPLPQIIDAAHRRGVPVLADGAQLAPHRPLPADADFLARSGHKMYAPFGTGVLAGPRPAITGYEHRIALSLRRGLAAIPGVRLLGPDLDAETLPVATFTVEGVPHALVAARLAAEYAIGVGHSRFCAYPYLIRLLGLTRGEVHRTATRRGARIAERCRGLSGPARASTYPMTTCDVCSLPSPASPRVTRRFAIIRTP
jgi:selenocysteine lyase/cysteine desulfurase